MGAYADKVNPVWEAISIYDGPDIFLRQFSAVPAGVGHLFASHWCQAEVRNGGFSQFFSNSTGILAPEAHAGFLAIGMPKAAEMVARAMAVYPTPYPRERYDRAMAGERIDWKRFDQLDDPFWKLLEEESGGFTAAADRYALTL